MKKKVKIISSVEELKDGLEVEGVISSEIDEILDALKDAINGREKKSAEKSAKYDLDQYYSKEHGEAIKIIELTDEEKEQWERVVELRKKEQVAREKFWEMVNENNPKYKNNQMKTLGREGIIVVWEAKL